VNAYSPEDYWEGLLGHHLDERGVAYPELAVALNRAMYRALEDSAERLLRDHGLAGRAGEAVGPAASSTSAPAPASGSSSGGGWAPTRSSGST
jgi:hypothetical protein